MVWKSIYHSNPSSSRSGEVCFRWPPKDVARPCRRLCPAQVGWQCWQCAGVMKPMHHVSHWMSLGKIIPSMVENNTHILDTSNQRILEIGKNMSVGKETMGTRPISSESWLLSPEGTRCLPTLFSTRHLGKPNCHCLWSQGGTETSLTQTTSHLWSDPSTPQRPAHGPAQTQTRKPVLRTVKGVHRTWGVCKKIQRWVLRFTLDCSRQTLMWHPHIFNRFNRPWGPQISWPY